MAAKGLKLVTNHFNVVINVVIFLEKYFFAMIPKECKRLAEVDVPIFKVLKQAVRRNIHLFPADFMFELTKEENKSLRSQNVTSSWGGLRYLPMVSTEKEKEWQKA